MAEQNPRERIIRLVDTVFEVTPEMVERYHSIVVRKATEDQDAIKLAYQKLTGVVEQGEAYDFNLFETRRGRKYFELRRKGAAA